MATLLSVSAIAMVVGFLRAPRLPCLDPSEGASAEKRTRFKVGVLGDAWCGEPAHSSQWHLRAALPVR